MVEELPQWESYLALGSSQTARGSDSARSPLAGLGAPYVPAVTWNGSDLEMNLQFIFLSCPFQPLIWASCEFEALTPTPVCRGDPYVLLCLL